MNSKPILGPCDSFQLEPFEYEWAWNMARDCEKNTWTPEEIGVGEDIESYRRCDTTQRHIFEMVMAQLTTFDIQRGDDAAEVMLKYIQPAELRHFIKRLIWEEALHTRSYRYIIENLNMDLEIYNRWQTERTLHNRVLYAEKMSLEVIQAETEDELKRNLYLYLVFWAAIYEGTWFMMSLLGPVQNLGRLGNFRAAADQFRYIARDEQQHVHFGIKLCNEYAKQYPEIFDDKLGKSLREMSRTCLGLEHEYIMLVNQKGQLLGYSTDQHVETSAFMMGENYRKLGIGSAIHWPEAEHQFPWFSEAVLLNAEVNFFEKRTKEYQSAGALEWDD